MKELIEASKAALAELNLVIAGDHASGSVSGAKLETALVLEKAIRQCEREIAKSEAKRDAGLEKCLTALFKQQGMLL